MMISCKGYTNGKMFGNTKRFAIFVYQIGMMKISKNIYFFFNDVVIDEKGTILSWNVKHMTLSKWQSLTARPHNTKWFLLDDVMPLNQIIAIRWSKFHNFRWKDSSNRHQSFEKNLSFSPEVIFTHLVRLISSNAIMYNLSLVASQTIWRVLVL